MNIEKDIKRRGESKRERWGDGEEGRRDSERDKKRRK